MAGRLEEDARMAFSDFSSQKSQQRITDAKAAFEKAFPGQVAEANYKYLEGGEFNWLVEIRTDGLVLAYSDDEKFRLGKKLFLFPPPLSFLCPIRVLCWSVPFVDKVGLGKQLDRFVQARSMAL